MASQTLVLEEPQIREDGDEEATIVSGVIYVTVDGPTKITLTGSGEGWSAAETTLTLQPEAGQPQPVRYELLTHIQTAGYGFGDPAVKLFPINGNSNISFGFERASITSTALVFINNVPLTGLSQSFETLFDIRPLDAVTGKPAGARLLFEADPTIIYEPPRG